jgi:putative transposase
MGGRADLQRAGDRPSSTYYSAKSRTLSARAISDAALIPLLVALFVNNYSVYGRRKLTKAARKAGLEVGRDQVARLMRAAGIRGAIRRSRKRFTTRSDPTHTRAPDLLRRDFTATRPDEKWVADFTYCSTWSGIVYVAFVVDVFSRRIVGWKAARTMAISLVLDALNMAAWTRRGTGIDGVICHSDAGSQPRLKGSSQRCCVRQSVGAGRGPLRVSSSRGSFGAGC